MGRKARYSPTLVGEVRFPVANITKIAFGGPDLRTVYATTGIADVDTKIEAQPRHKRQWPFIGSLVSS